MSAARKHSLVIGGRRTAISLEPAFYAELKRIAQRRQAPLHALVDLVDRDHRGDAPNLSSALRVFVLADLQARTKEKGHG